MKMITKLFFLAFILVSLTACGDDDMDAPVNRFELRLRNMSSQTMTNVTLTADGTVFSFPDVGSFSATQYDNFTGIFNNGTISVTVTDGVETVAVSGTGIAEGQYTYELTLENCTGTNCDLAAVLIKD